MTANIKKFKIFSPIKIIVAISLILNVILLSMLLIYQGFINDGLFRSFRRMESTLTESQEILGYIIRHKEIDEKQYGELYFMFDDLEYVYKHDLYNYYNEFGSKDRDFTNIGLLFDMNDYLFHFGRDKNLSLLKRAKDEYISMNLTENEVTDFQSIYNKNEEYINVINKYNLKENDVQKNNWIKIIEEIYYIGIK